MLTAFGGSIDRIYGSVVNKNSGSAAFSGFIVVRLLAKHRKY